MNRRIEGSSLGFGSAFAKIHLVSDKVPQLTEAGGWVPPKSASIALGSLGFGLLIPSVLATVAARTCALMLPGDSADPSVAYLGLELPALPGKT